MKGPENRRRAREAFIEKRLTSTRGFDPLERIYVAESRVHPEDQGKSGTARW